MPKSDRDHFDEYTPQNRAKHEILKAYLGRYATVLKNGASCFHYIDGFAGRGIYDARHLGSPLLAIEVLASLSLITRSTISLVESNSTFKAELEAAISEHSQASLLREPPLVREGRFSEHIDEILNRDIYRRGSTATFAFIDPCGVDGVRLRDIARVLGLSYGEVLLFFNYSGVNRLIGGVRAGTHDARILIDLFGTAERVQRLTTALQSASDPEIIVRDALVAAVRECSGADFFVPFRFEARDRDRTSHYLVHCCSNSLGFKLMKEVMWRICRDEIDPYGSLEFRRDAERGQFLLYRVDIQARKEDILEALAKTPRQVREFTDRWVERPDDLFCGTVYRQMLIELEEAGEIKVFDKANRLPCPADRRRRNKGRPTLGPDYWLRKT